MALASMRVGGGEDHACRTLQQAAARRAAPSARAARPEVLKLAGWMTTPMINAVARSGVKPGPAQTEPSPPHPSPLPHWGLDPFDRSAIEPSGADRRAVGRVEGCVGLARRSRALPEAG